LLNELKKFNENQKEQKCIIEILKIFETLLAVVDSTLRKFGFSFNIGNQS